eukprot:SAG31_NODE_7366_length_1708_cov_10.433188_1_plen_368_part_01
MRTPRQTNTVLQMTALRRLRSNPESATEDDVEAFLHSIRCASLADVFRSAAIDGPALFELVDQDLQCELGITSESTRRLLLAEVRFLAGNKRSTGSGRAFSLHTTTTAQEASPLPAALESRAVARPDEFQRHRWSTERIKVIDNPFIGSPPCPKDLREAVAAGSSPLPYVPQQDDKKRWRAEQEHLMEERRQHQLERAQWQEERRNWDSMLQQERGTWERSVEKERQVWLADQQELGAELTAQITSAENNRVELEAKLAEARRWAERAVARSNRLLREKKHLEKQIGKTMLPGEAAPTDDKTAAGRSDSHPLELKENNPTSHKVEPEKQHTASAKRDVALARAEAEAEEHRARRVKAEAELMRLRASA